MKIALDYDETFTADPELWREFVAHARRNGHHVAFVTFRSPGFDNRDIEQHAQMLGISIIYSAGRQKSHVYGADIWIDDMPQLIPSLDAMRAMTIGCERMGDVAAEVSRG